MSAIVVKLGSSTLVAPDGRLRDEVLEARVRDLVRLQHRGQRPVLVSSGAALLQHFSPATFEGGINHPGVIGAVFGVLMAASIIIQTLLTRKAPSEKSDGAKGAKGSA